MMTINSSNLPTDVPAVIGEALSILLYGILVVQAFIYFTRFPNDSKWIRLFILFIFVIETFAAVVVLYEMAEGAKVHCLSCIPLSWASSWDISWSFQILSILTGFVALLAHGFYCWRIYVLSSYWYIPVFVMLSSLLQCIFLGIGIMLPNLIKDPTIMSDVWGISTIVCDSVITTETTRLLLRRKKKSTFAEETNGLITRLIQLTIETGAVTVGAMVLRFVIYSYDMTTDAVVSMNNQEIVISPWPFSISISQLFVSYSITRLYANCVLASLNARLVISRDNTRVEAVSTVLFDRSELRTKEQPAEISSV